MDNHDYLLDGNVTVETAISKFNTDKSKDNFANILESIRLRMHDKGQFLVPCLTPQAAIDMIDLENVKVGDVITAKEDLHFRLETLHDDDGKVWLAAFTSKKEMEKGRYESPLSSISVDIKDFLKYCCDISEEGVIINPWDEYFLLSKEAIKLIFEADKPKNQIFFDVGDITRLNVDAIVNAANKTLLGGGGVDGAIHRAAGPGLLEECKKLNGCETGKAKITGGYLLKAKYVIHAVGPRYIPGDKKCPEQLRDCYFNSLELAKQYDIHTIAFPAISTGIYGYPKQEAAEIALLTVSKWLHDNPEYGMAVVMSCYDEEMKKIYQNAVDKLST